MYNIIFFGTSDFAIPSLEALAQDERFHIQAIVTQPDRPVGRHALITPPPIKKSAQHIPQCAHTPIIQPEKIKEEEKYDGYYSIVTSELKMTDMEIRDTYRVIDLTV